MRKTIFVFVNILLFALIACDTPDVLKQEAFLIVENNSSSYNITGIYYSNSGYGSNRISSNIGPGGSKTCTLSSEGDHEYNIMVTSDNPDLEDYTFDNVSFYDDRRITITLEDDYWGESYPW